MEWMEFGNYLNVVEREVKKSKLAHQFPACMTGGWCCQSQQQGCHEKKRILFYYYHRRNDEFGLSIKVVLFLILNDNCSYRKGS